MCKSLFHCNYVCISYRFWDIQPQIMVWPWNMGYRSRKITENGTIWKLRYSFLFAFHSNYGSILYHFKDKARYWLKIVIFHTPAFDTPIRGPYRSIAIVFGTEKLEWCGYPTVNKFNRFSHFDRTSAAACDGWRDRQTDRWTSCDSIVCAMHSIAR